MRAKVIQAFPGAPDGAIHPRQIEVGEVIEGDLARVAVDQKWAEETDEEVSDDSVDFAEMTVDQLRAYAVDHDIDLGTATKKAAIISAIKKAAE
ncbi:hypothetical protein [Mesorhizobium sp. B2-1-3A]|uniref:hypothetical protein n=1 Tax=Mesorhizobium sp. B2-1-3A TaxID=2589971 RepID=UPI00112A9464|nr:hypothetical protein [Mesorhizobium sp. B2-1-3A]TPM92721.1 hypothetical protein FJ977_27975 [Mesorhizobium sp. B2-1-3A]